MPQQLPGLRQREERYRVLFNSVDEAFAICETVSGETGSPVDFRFIELNPAFDVHNRTAVLAVDLVESLFGKSTLMRN